MFLEITHSKVITQMSEISLFTNFISFEKHNMVFRKYGKLEDEETWGKKRKNRKKKATAIE